MISIRRRIALAGLTLAVAVTTAHAANEVALFVGRNDVNLRDGPGTENTTVIGYLQLGDEVRVRGQEGQWREVWCPRIRKTGWVAHWLLAEAPPQGVRREIAAANADQLCLRTGPGQSYDVKTCLDKGTVLDVIAYHDQWRKVRIPGKDTVGWVAAWLLRPAAATDAMVAASAGESQGTRWVKGDMLYLRSGPGTDSQAFALLHQGTPMEIHAIAGEWVQVAVSNSMVGWVHRDYIGVEPVAGMAGGVTVLDAAQMRESYDPELEQRLETLAWNQAYVTGDTCNIRQGPGSSFAVVGTADRGDVFQVLGASSGWYKGIFEGGREGWLAGWLCVAAQQPQEIAAVPDAPPLPPVGPEAEAGRRIAQTALTMLGKPYRSAGMSPESGFDCSGLTTWSHAQNGITIPRVAHAQWQAGRPVPSESLLPGDVVCFGGTSAYIGHVGIYVGNGIFVHAPQTGDVVRTVPLSSRRDFRGGRRFW